MTSFLFFDILEVLNVAEVREVRGQFQNHTLWIKKTYQIQKEEMKQLEGTFINGYTFVQKNKQSFFISNSFNMSISTITSHLSNIYLIYTMSQLVSWIMNAFHIGQAF